jgi:hypothetical protein
MREQFSLAKLSGYLGSAKKPNLTVKKLANMHVVSMVMSDVSATSCTKFSIDNHYNIGFSCYNSIVIF